ncbi:putative sugar O-methyltransferase [Bradyrhizobium sp. CCGB12]|uniref:putative sugar O-methyltransferase n=1 Tax=Bradyrhizobium sp. CCGB12 TaxID=2949632 RepID=UPI0020B2045F|nr:putative sugar O-methyltransferase [Bradyrhizobium sp. CCGB12]MCP3391900.1 putative sugar O-methyltransferase [Bradyrhizobium sp. CCGB12]
MGVFEMVGRLTRARPKDLRIASHLQNQKLSEASILRAQRLGAAITNSVRRRRELIASSAEINEGFAMPAANWDAEAANDYLRCYTLLATLTPQEIRLLRFRAQNFTGNNLGRMGPGVGTSGTNPVADDLATKWSKEQRDQVVSHWQALTKDLPSQFVLNAPNILGECGWWWRNQILNVDIVDYQERMSLIALSGVLERFHGRSLRILEIGGGYGALCLGVLNALKPTQYVICDLPESLLFSGLYLTVALDRDVRLAGTEISIDQSSIGEVCLLPNYLAQTHLRGQQFDLVINTLSMSEMSPHQVKIYAELISNAIGSHGVFFEQNHNNKPSGLIDCKDYLPPFFRKQETVEASIPIIRGLASAWSN